MKDRDHGRPGANRFLLYAGAAAAGVSLAILTHPANPQTRAFNTDTGVGNTFIPQETSGLSSAEIQKALAETGGQLSPYFNEYPEVSRWNLKMRPYLYKYKNVNINQASTVMLLESGGNQYAVSRGGAIGLFQLLPKTFYWISPAWLYDPDTNMELGIHYLSDQLTAYNGNLKAALAAYNGGPMAALMVEGKKSPNEYVNNLLAVGWSYSEATQKVTQVYDYVNRGEEIYSEAINGLNSP